MTCSKLFCNVQLYLNTRLILCCMTCTAAFSNAISFFLHQHYYVFHLCSVLYVFCLWSSIYFLKSNCQSFHCLLETIIRLLSNEPSTARCLFTVIFSAWSISQFCNFCYIRISNVLFVYCLELQPHSCNLLGYMFTSQYSFFQPFKRWQYAASLTTMFAQKMATCSQLEHHVRTKDGNVQPAWPPCSLKRWPLSIMARFTNVTIIITIFDHHVRTKWLLYMWS